MSSLREEELINILPKDGPTVEEVKKYLEKYNDEFIVIKCGGSVLIDPKLLIIYAFVSANAERSISLLTVLLFF